MGSIIGAQIAAVEKVPEAEAILGSSGVMPAGGRAALEKLRRGQPERFGFEGLGDKNAIGGQFRQLGLEPPRGDNDLHRRPAISHMVGQPDAIH